MTHARRLIGIVTLASIGLWSAGAAAAATSAPSSTAGKNWPSQMTVGTGAVGGSGYALMSVWAPVVNDQLKVNISVQAIGGVEATTRLVHAGQADLGLSSGAIAYEGWNGEGKWTQGVKMTNVRTLLVLQPYVLQFWTLKKTGIHNVQDMNGKHLSLNRVGTGAYTWSSRALELLKVKPARVSNIAPGQSNDLLKDGLLDVATAHGSVPHNAIQELSVNNDVVVFSLGKEGTEAYVRAWPALGAYVIPANTYKGQSEPIHTVAEALLLVGHKDLPEDLVYQLVKTTIDQKKTLIAGYAPFAQMDVQKIVTSPIPLHPGAYRYFREQGIQLPDRLAPRQ